MLGKWKDQDSEMGKQILCRSIYAVTPKGSVGTDNKFNCYLWHKYSANLCDILEMVFQDCVFITIFAFFISQVVYHFTD